MGGSNVSRLVLEAAEVGHALHVMTTLISSVEGHIKELVIDGLWPEDLWDSAGKSAGTCHYVVQSGIINLFLKTMCYCEMTQIRL